MTQLPPLKQTPPVTQHPKRLRPKTYSVAVYMVIAIVALQVVMLISVFWLRAMVVSVNVKLPQKAGNTPLVSASGVVTPKPVKPNVDKFGIAPLPGIPATGVHPALLKVPDANDELAQIDTLNQEAQVFLKQNDYQSALDMLIHAEDIDPRHPTTLKNLAETYNLTNNPVRSKIYWQRVADLGRAVGTIYGVAVDHVLLANSGHDASPLREPSTLDRLIYVDTVEKSPVETKNGNAQFHVGAVMMRKAPKTDAFDQKKLQPYVIFYQQMPDGTLVPDLGQRKGAFEDTFLFWGDKKTESFGVDYVMPVQGSPGPDGKPQGKYYGFVIGLYYDKVLQDVRSEPSDLSARMALPRDIE